MPSKTVQYGTARTLPFFTDYFVSTASTHCSAFCYQNRLKVHDFYLVSGRACQSKKGVTALREEQLLPRGYPTISVVIPALNEARNLRHVLPLTPPNVSEIILGDGCSV